jgi:hypothetical protein
MMYDDQNDGGLREFQERDAQEQQEREEGNMNVYQAICAVAKEMATEGISKDRKNVQQNYSFRGIDDVYNALAPRLAAHGLVILPRMISRTVTERETAKGGVLFYVVVEAEFDFVSAADGTRHTIKTYGEAMDSGDKATNKAMSAAYKYAAMQAFCIPTEGDNDADYSTHEVKAKPKGMSPEDLASVIDYIEVAETEKALQNLYRQASQGGASDAQMERVTLVCAARKKIILARDA